MVIKNDRQYAVTRTQAAAFREAIAHIEAYPEQSAHLHPLLQKAERDALWSQMETLEDEMAAYEAKTSISPHSRRPEPTT